MKKSSIILLSALLLGSFLNTSAIMQNTLAAPNSPDPSWIFRYGVNSLVYDLDPHFAWDSASIDTIDQVCEGLFTYDLNDPELAIIPRLATSLGTWNNNATEYTVQLRNDVTFHDGWPFNASAVAWNFARLQYLINYKSSQIAELYKPLYNEPVLDKVIINDNYNVTFKLNYAYVPFVSLLCFSGSYMLSPNPISTPEQEYLMAGVDTLVGTGPFKYINSTSQETVFVRNENYYRGLAGIPEMHWIWYSDIEQQNALLNGEIDMIDKPKDSYLSQFEADEDIILTPQIRSTMFYYIGMNNQVINKTYRQAISYATNYTYILNNIYNSPCVRSESPVPECTMYHNPNIHAADMNLTRARSILIDAGLTSLTLSSADSEWEALAAGTNPIATYNYTYNEGNQYRTDLGFLLQDNLKEIGIAIERNGITWSQFLDLLFRTHEKLGIYTLGWGPDYNDPSNYINPLFSNTSSSNTAQVNDPYLQVLMMDALTETNETARCEMYYEMQRYIVEELMPWLFLWVPLSQLAYRSDYQSNFAPIQNSMEKLDFYSACSYLDTQPNVNFQVDGPNLIAGEILNFIDTTSEGNHPFSYVWDFGDGTNSTEQNANHSYSQGSTYMVHLTVTDFDGDTSSHSMLIVIEDDIHPVADITVEDTSIVIGDTISFSSADSIGNQPLKYLWDFGDGTFSTDANPAHLYSSTGDFTVILYITDANGEIAQTTLMITVNEATTTTTTTTSTNNPYDIPGYPILLIFGFSIIGLIFLKRKQK